MHPEVLSPAAPPAPDSLLLELGILVGHHQLAGWVASKCSAVDAQVLQQIRDQRLYKPLGLNWEQFCEKYCGISHDTANRIIAARSDFGDTYFNLCQILPLTTNEYRELQPNINADTLEFDGQKIPITRENSARVIAAVDTLRARLQRVTTIAARGPYTTLEIRVDRYLSQLSGLIRRRPKAYEMSQIKHILYKLLTKTQELYKEADAASIADPSCPTESRPEASS